MQVSNLTQVVTEENLQKFFAAVPCRLGFPSHKLKKGERGASAPWSLASAWVEYHLQTFSFSLGGSRNIPNFQGADAPRSP
jgi:hypothetical protein